MALTNLDFLQKGQPWPPKGEAERLKEYSDNEALRSGEVNDIWPDLYKYLRDGSTYQQDFYIGFPWLVTKKAVDTVIGEPPVFSLPKQGEESAPTAKDQQLTDLLLQVNYRQILREQIADIDAFGDSVQKIFRDEAGQVQIQSIPPENWYPVVKKGTRHIEFHVLAFQFEDEKNKEKCYLEVEIHSRKQIEHRIYELNRPMAAGRASEIGELLSWEDLRPGVKQTEENPLGEILIITAHNHRMSGDIYGSSSYGADFKSILKRIIIRYSTTNNILDVFCRPTLVGPRNLETYDPVTMKNIFRPGEYKGIDVDPRTTPMIPQAVVWDAHLTEAQAIIKDLEEKLYIVAELPKAAVSMEASGVAASGVAWKLAMTPLLSKCARIRDELDAAAKKAINIALRLSGQNLEGIQISWQDGLPQIPIEQAAEFSQLSSSPAFQGEVGITWLLQNKLGLSQEKAQKIAADPSRGGGLGLAV